MFLIPGVGIMPEGLLGRQETWQTERERGRALGSAAPFTAFKEERIVSPGNSNHSTELCRTWMVPFLHLPVKTYC